MRFSHAIGLLCSVSLLASCGGSSGGSGGGNGGGGGGTGVCSLTQRQAWVLDQLEEWYLFPDLLDTDVDPDNHDTVQSYIDALVRPAREAGVDRGFTYITSIEEENAFFEEGKNIGFGFRLVLTAANELIISEAFEGAPAFEEGFDRGTEILAIGEDQDDLTSVDTLIANGTLDEALGPSEEGVTRWFEIVPAGASDSQVVSITKADYELLPISPRYGSLILNDGGKQVGYINLRTFIETAEQPLRDAFFSYRTAGINQVIIDLRYNGGGLVRTAELMGDLMGRNLSGQVFSYTTFRDSKSGNNDTELFEPTGNSIQPLRLAFIGRTGTASASELLINSMQAWIDNTALVGTDTFGKPVGQIAQDRSACDDRLRILAFKTENADHEGEYFDGLAEIMPATCRADDEFSVQLGQPNEDSIEVSLDYLSGGQAACTPIAGTFSLASARTVPLLAKRPSAAQREVPGLF